MIVSFAGDSYRYTGPLNTYHCFSLGFMLLYFGFVWVFFVAFVVSVAVVGTSCEAAAAATSPLLSRSMFSNSSNNERSSETLADTSADTSAGTSHARRGRPRRERTCSLPPSPHREVLVHSRAPPPLHCSLQPTCLIL